MAGRLFEAIKEERMAWSWAIVVCLLLIFVAHAPALPVIAGGFLAIGISVLRSQRRPRTFEPLP